MKRCTGCGETKDLSEFTKDRSKPDGVRHRCRPCATRDRRIARARLTPEQREQRRAVQNAWREKNRETYLRLARESYRRNRESRAAKARERLTGVTAEQYDAVFAVQGGRCAICQKPQSGQKRKFAADHCHMTGSFRGVLCDNCNHGLGKFKDDPALLAAAVTYLEKWRSAASARA